MSLDADQRAQTSTELRANFDLSGLTVERIAADLELDPAQVEDALAMRPETNGTIVWRLRDYLEERVEETGQEPVPFTVLKVNRWFPYHR